MSEENKFKAWWAGLTPGKRNVFAIAALFITLGAAGALISPKGSGKASGKDVSTTNLVLPNRKDLTQEGLAAGLSAATSRVNDLERKVEQLRGQRDVLLKQAEDGQNLDQGIHPEVVREVAALRRELESMKTGKPSLPAPGLPSLDAPLPNLTVPTAQQPIGVREGGSLPASIEAEAPPKRRLRVVGAVAPTTVAQRPEIKEPLPYLPAGAVFEGVLLNGMDAPTSSVTQKNPVPALIRIKSDSIIPNLMSMGEHDIRECFLVVSGHGVLATERAQLRTETLSCVRENGKVIESELDGYAVGEDGKVGMRGRLVSKQGQLIAKSLIAGFVSGFGQAASPLQIPQVNTSGDGRQYETPDLGMAAQYGLGKGISESSRMVAQFYLDMAKEMFPVVEVDAGRKVSIVTLRGIQLAPRGNPTVATRNDRQESKQ